MLTAHKQVSSSKNSNEKQQLGLPVVIGALILLAILLGYMGHQFFAPSGPSLSQAWGMDKSSFPSWVNDAAMQCKGDMSKLSPELQQKIAAQYKDGGRTEIMASYALQTH